LNTIQSLLLTQSGGGGGGWVGTATSDLDMNIYQITTGNVAGNNSVLTNSGLSFLDQIDESSSLTKNTLQLKNAGTPETDIQRGTVHLTEIATGKQTLMTTSQVIVIDQDINKSIQITVDQIAVDGNYGNPGDVLVKNGANELIWSGLPQSFITGYLTKSRSCLPTLTQLSTVIFTSLPVPSIWVQDQEPPINQNGHWGFAKPIGDVRKFNWTCFDPYYPAVPSVGVPPSAIILKSQLQAFYIIVTLNTVMLSSAQQGYLYFEIYSYDYVNGSSTFFTNQWTYVMPTNALPWVTTASLNLQAGQRCLLYARDDQKVVANPASPATFASGNGQALNQNSYLGDPFSLHTDIPHIAFNFANYNITPTPQPININSIAISKLNISCVSGAKLSALNLDIETIGYITQDTNLETNLNY
jgi:hypothetical protein